MTDLHALCLNLWAAAISARLDLTSASDLSLDSLTASSLQTLLQPFCNILFPTCITMHHMPNSCCAKHPVPHLCCADPDGLPCFLTSAVSGTGHQIHTPYTETAALQIANTHKDACKDSKLLVRYHMSVCLGPKTQSISARVDVED